MSGRAVCRCRAVASPTIPAPIIVMSVSAELIMRTPKYVLVNSSKTGRKRKQVLIPFQRRKTNGFQPDIRPDSEGKFIHVIAIDV